MSSTETERRTSICVTFGPRPKWNRGNSKCAPSASGSALATNSSVSSSQTGPGNDWRCIVSWHTPGTAFVGQAIFQLDVTPDGRYVADGDGPKEVNGSFPVHTAQGDAPNPLWQFDGLVDLLARHQ